MKHNEQISANIAGVWNQISADQLAMQQDLSDKKVKLVEKNYVDIQRYCYLANGKKVLITFSQIYGNDAATVEYAKDPSIKLSDILEGSIHSRICLDDHLTSASYKLATNCCALHGKKIIKRVSLINAVLPKAKVVQLDDSIVILTKSKFSSYSCQETWQSSKSLDTSNLRPISILPVLSNVFEYIIEAQIINHLEDNSLLFESQQGFRKGCSSTSCWV